MFRADLFKEVLERPAERGSDKLFVVSGYASAAMVYRHFEVLPLTVSIELLVGMSPAEGLVKGDHQSFQQLVSDFPGRFICRYLKAPPSVHSKIYTWLKGNKPAEGFVGSPNYTQVAFFSRAREEVVVPYNPNLCAKAYLSISQNSIDCTDSAAERIVKIHERRGRVPRGFYPEYLTPDPEESERRREEAPQPFQPSEDQVTLSLLEGSGDTPARSGLNWGQRPSRDHDQAYIPVPAPIARSGFFPPRGTHFTLVTDDDQTFDCVVAQDGAKAIESSRNNALLGKYFRKRLSLPSGAYIRKEHLLSYGRTDVTVSKIDDENYSLGFSPAKGKK